LSKGHARPIVRSSLAPVDTFADRRLQFATGRAIPAHRVEQGTTMNELRTAPGDPGMQPLRNLAPTLAAYAALDCGLVRCGRDRWLVFFAGMLQSDHPFETRAGAIRHLAHLDTINAPAAVRAIEAEQAAIRG
jgi:hypothetical protein